MNKEKLLAPFPYFGGKSQIANAVWGALGQPRHYIEPFAGSIAVLLRRPDYDPRNHTETICDTNPHIANIWRAMQFKPEETASFCDWPVNHVDLSARRNELNRQHDDLLQNMIIDPEYCDPRLAGYYIWAASCWIGNGLDRINQRPHLSHTGKGVHKISQIPHLSDAGKGVHKVSKIPHLGDTGIGVHKISERNGIYDWFDELSNRLRYVRVVCGDWKRVCGGNWQGKMGDVGIFFDPPYGEKANRVSNLYGNYDSLQVSDEVRVWCIERGKLKSYKIVLAGYYEEHKELIDHGWRVVRWKANGGYGNQGNGQGKENREKETLFLSPYCIAANNENNLFDWE